jgi:hypothetical protein
MHAAGTCAQGRAAVLRGGTCCHCKAPLPPLLIRMQSAVLSLLCKQCPVLILAGDCCPWITTLASTALGSRLQCQWSLLHAEHNTQMIVSQQANATH